jgi:hypothetical protein
VDRNLRGQSTATTAPSVDLTHQPVGRHFTRTHQRVLRCERQSSVHGPCCLPRVLITNAHSVDGSPAPPEQHARRLRVGVEIAEDNRGPVPRVLLNRKRSAPSLLLTLHLEWKRPTRFVMRNDQWTESRFQLDDQGGAPWKVLTMFNGARRSQSGLAGPSTLKVTPRKPTGSAVTVEVNHSSAGSSTSCASHLSRGGMLPLLLPCETVLEEASRRTMLA